MAERNRKNSVIGRLTTWLKGEELPTAGEQIRLASTRGGIQMSITSLPESANDTAIGTRIVNGELCKTVGEYKDALARNNTDMNGWSG